jgi:transposase-like protein
MQASKINNSRNNISRYKKAIKNLVHGNMVGDHPKEWCKRHKVTACAWGEKLRNRFTWTWFHKIRTAMVNPNRAKLSGCVGVDETYIGGESKGKRGRGSENKTRVIVCVELLEGKNQLGRVRMDLVPNATNKSLQGYIKCNIEIGSTVVTDGWPSYTSLPKEGYVHFIEKPFDPDNEDEILTHVHIIVSLLKRWLLGTH